MTIHRMYSKPFFAGLLWAVAVFLCPSGSAISADSGRSVTLTEPTGSSQHTYNEATPGGTRRSNSADRTILNHWPILWLYDVAITFNQDYDGDGYHSNFTITFDFDTDYETTLVYAVLYVSSGNGQWLEYAVTGNFTIGGTSTSDAYTIYANLDSGYATGHYDHLIEIYDARTNSFLAEFGPADSHVLHGLPIESRPLDYHRGISTSVSLQFSGTGSVDPRLIGVLLLTVLGTFLRRRFSELMNC